MKEKIKKILDEWGFTLHWTHDIPMTNEQVANLIMRELGL